MVTRLDSDISNLVSEERIMFDPILLQNEEAIYIDGIGWICQYHNWFDVLWEKGIPYFMRDLKVKDLTNLKQNCINTRVLEREIDFLNSKILEWEQCH